MKISIKIIVMLLLTGMASSTLNAQGFSSILKKVDEIEKQLALLENSQKKGLGNLQGQLNKLKKSTFDATELNTIKEDINQALEELQKLKEQSEKSGVSQALVTDLLNLTGELRTVISEPPEQQPDSDEEIDQVISGPDFDISGFVDASYFYDGNTGGNTFGLDQVEVDIEKSIGENGSIRADLEWVSDGAGGFALDAEQGYITFNPEFLGTVNLTFGKFNAPIGFELLDAPDMYQYSHALVFDNGLPTNLSGAMFSSNLNESVDLSVYVCNGWDQNVDINTGKTAGGRLGYAAGENWAGGVSVIHGANGTAEGDFLTVFDVDLAVTSVENLTLGAEFNNGGEDITTFTDTTNTTTETNTAKWMGFLLMAHYDFSDCWGITFRYDYFDDKDGSRLGTVEKRQAITVGLTFALGEGMGALIEIRNDFSDQEVFMDKDGKPVKSQFGAAFEFTFTF